MNQGGSVKENGLAPIPTPDDFPVQWESAEDQRLFWTHGRMHHAHQLMPLEEVYFRDFIEHGHNVAAEEYELVMRVKNRLINTYSYSARIPIIKSGAEMKAQTERSEKKMAIAMTSLGDLWETEFLPEIKQYIEAWESVDFQKYTMPELIKELEQVIARTRRFGEIHFRIVGPMNEARSRFEDLYEDLFGERSNEAYRLLQGFDNKSLESNRELWKLSRSILSSSEVLSIMKTKGLDRVLPELEKVPEGRRFLDALRSFLKEYGRRSDNFSLREPFWIEDPTGVIQKLSQFMTGPDQGKDDPTKVAKEREELLTQTRKRLEGYPAEVINRFESALKNARVANTLSEDHAFWIDNIIMYYLRRIFLEFGRRFSEVGVLHEADDVWHLKLDELFETAHQFPKLDRHQLIVERKAYAERFRSKSPPDALGSRRTGPRPDSKSGRAVSKFMGRHATQAPFVSFDDPNTFSGQAASSGITRGPACVCRSLSEASKLKSGDILVAETTLPPWTHLFTIATAVVTDVGGILSHCAVVAREYGIPAVVDTGVATSRIKDGQLIEVDGDAGVVKILSSS